MNVIKLLTKWHMNDTTMCESLCVHLSEAQINSKTKKAFLTVRNKWVIWIKRNTRHTHKSWAGVSRQKRPCRPLTALHRFEMLRKYLLWYCFYTLFKLITNLYTFTSGGRLKEKNISFHPKRRAENESLTVSPNFTYNSFLTLPASGQPQLP